MKKLVVLPFLIGSLCAFAQKNKVDTLTGDAAKEVLKGMKFDSSFLKNAGDAACKCITKIKIKNKSAEEISAGISKCISNEASSYSMSLQMMEALKGDKKENTIYLGEKGEKDKYYFQIENWLRDNCGAMNYIIAADNKESENSISSNKEALKYYKKGQIAMQNDAYADAETYFQKAVAEDDQFVFAWDNLGLMLRKQERYPEAAAAYKKSIAIDPKNITALQNLAVVYGLQKNSDKALECYMNIIKLYPENPEGYYGAGLIYIDPKNDLENGLDYMCKAYNLYIKIGSPYRADAASNMKYIYNQLKEQGKEATFARILKENNISSE